MTSTGCLQSMLWPPLIPCPLKRTVSSYLTGSLSSLIPFHTARYTDTSNIFFYKTLLHKHCHSVQLTPENVLKTRKFRILSGCLTTVHCVVNIVLMLCCSTENVLLNRYIYRLILASVCVCVCGSSGCSSVEDAVWFPLRACLCPGTQCMSVNITCTFWCAVKMNFSITINQPQVKDHSDRMLKSCLSLVYRAISITLPTVTQ